MDDQFFDDMADRIIQGVTTQLVIASLTMIVLVTLMMVA
jgi:hypothetical protein